MRKNATLDDACSFFSGNAWKASKFRDEGEIPVIRIQNLSNEGNGFVYWNDEYDQRFIVKKGDLLLGLSGSIKVDYWNGPEALLNQRIVKISEKKGVDRRWLYWQIIRVLKEIESIGKHALVNNVALTDLKAFNLDIPPQATQQKIAAILDEADALRRKDRELIKKYDELLQSVFYSMFGDPVKNEKGWEMKRLCDASDNFDYTRKPVKSSDRELMSGTYPYYGATGIIDYVNEFLLEGEYLLISEDGKNLLGRYKKIAFIANGKFWVNNHAHVIKANDLSNNFYLEHYLNRSDLKQYVTGIDQLKLNRANLDIIPIAAPPIELQNEFATIVENIEGQKAKLITQQQQSETLFHSLLQRAFKGELVE